jgi:hypothetical protein
MYYLAMRGIEEFFISIYIYIYIYIYIILFLNFFYDCEKELEEAKYFENDFLII